MLALLIALKMWILANQVGIAAVVGWAMLEWGLPRIKFLKANSTVELLANLAKRMLLNRIPLVGRVVTVLATPDDEHPKMKIPGASALLPFLFVGALLVSGCTTPAGKALKTCELGALPAAMQSVEAQVLAVAMDPSTWATDLVTLAVKLGKDQVACAAQALATFFDKTPAPDTLASSVRAFASRPPVDSEARAHAKKVLHDYLTMPGTATSCRPVKVAQIEACEGACRPVVVDDGVPETVQR